MATFADQWNARPPPDIVLSRHAKVITVSKSGDDVREVLDDVRDDSDDFEMEDVAALAVVNDVNDVRLGWLHYGGTTAEQQDHWGDAMDIDYESTSRGVGAVKMVIDTNILLSCLDRLKDIYYALCESDYTHGLQLIIPGIVLQELDAQTKYYRSEKPELRNLAQAATYWLLDQLKLRKTGGASIVRVQRDYETHIGGISWKLSRRSNDDLILDCCQYFSATSQTVYLLTNDVNLSVKAEAHDIPTLDRQELRHPKDFIKKFIPSNSPEHVDPVLPSKSHAHRTHSTHIGNGRLHQHTPQHHHSHNYNLRSKHQDPPSASITSQLTRHPSKRQLISAPADEAGISSLPTSGSPEPPSDSIVDDDVEMMDDENDPRHSLEALHTAFLDHLSKYLPGQVVAFLKTPRHLGKGDRKTSTNFGAHYAKPPEGSDSWTPQRCLKELEHVRPLKRSSTPIEWTSLFAFTAKPGESGYRANGGGPGDWKKVIAMLGAVGDAYALDCINVRTLEMLGQMMNSAAGLTPSRA